MHFTVLYNTVKPVLSQPVLSGHPPLSSQLKKSWKILPLITLNLTSIERLWSPIPWSLSELF